ncbi:HNH endonuclease [Mesobacillus jeotgali]|uniref:HNH endonuclease n=1 Tax=Mesobacillus jeotgali TaxID=129985 RepID=UPI00177BEC5D|nr:HNH endonuclease [Mesobacillus jeotgali]UYZ20736.1 HNH endonuclease [Mesobacillus jeotgali]
MNLTREYLYQKYIHDKMSLKEIAEETGLPSTTIKSRLRRLGIRKKPIKLGNEIYDNRDWLYEEYIVKRKGYTVLANELGVSYSTILDRILFFGWELRGHNEIDKGAPRRGTKHTPVSLEKIKATRIKKRVYFECFQCGKTTERVRSGYSRSGKRFCTYTCYKNYLKENRVETIDITDSALYKEWRKKVYTRDNFRCKMPGCNSNSRDIAAHHIYPKKLFPEKQFLLNNGITLCRNCHEKTYGKESNFIDALVRVVQKMNG